MPVRKSRNSRNGGQRHRILESGFQKKESVNHSTYGRCQYAQAEDQPEPTVNAANCGCFHILPAVFKSGIEGAAIAGAELRSICPTSISDHPSCCSIVDISQVFDFHICRESTL